MEQLSHELIAWLLAAEVGDNSTNGSSLNESNAKTAISLLPFENGGGELIQVQKELLGGSDRDKYAELTARLSHHALAPALKKFMQVAGRLAISHFELMFSRDSSGAIGKVICLHESYRTPFVDAVANKRTFRDWMIQFRPRTRQECALALPLYSMCRREEDFRVPRISPTPDPWLDSMLRDTRGMLLWTHHWQEFLRIACGFSAREVAECMYKINLGRLKAVELFRAHVYEPTGLNLDQVFNERSPFPTPIGHQDHLTGDWIWDHLACKSVDTNFATQSK